MPFSIPVVSATLVWSVKCHHTDSRFSFQESDPADGMLTVHAVAAEENTHNYRLAKLEAEFVSVDTSFKEDDATVFDDSIFVGQPYTDLVFYEKRSWVETPFTYADTGESVWEWYPVNREDIVQARFRETEDPEGRSIIADDLNGLDTGTVGEIYRIHNAMRMLQLAYRKKVALRAAQSAAFRETMADCGALTPDEVDCVIAKLQKHAV